MSKKNNMRFNDLDIYNKKFSKKFLYQSKKILLKNKFIFSEEVQQLERKLCKYTKSKYCITTGSGTDSITLALMSLNLKKNDEIIIPSFSWLSVVESVLLLKLKPIYADIEISSFNIDINSIKKLITKNTKAIISTSLFGRPSKLIEIKKICKKNNITFIEDAAQNFGSIIKKKNCLSIADITCASFFPSKNLGSFGDAGAIFTNKKNIYNILIKLRNHGQSSYSISKFVGLNSRIGSIQSSILILKLSFIREKIIKQRRLYKSYENFFNKKNIFGFPKLEYGQAVSHFNLLVKKRKILINYLKKNKIPFKIYYPKPLYTQFNQRIKIKHKITEQVCNQIISLPFNELNSFRHKKVLNLLKILIDNRRGIFFEKKN